MSGPKVTIAIPTLNRAKYLALSLDSALAQTYGNIEVVVSNNASSDETRQCLSERADPRMKVLHQPVTLSMVENWNACVASTTGDYFLLLSDDDLLEPTAIEELVAAYVHGDRAGIAPGIAYCGGRMIDAEGATLQIFKPSAATESARELVPSFFRGQRDLWLCAILFRVSEVRQGFSADYCWAPDSVLWIRSVLRYGTASYVDKDLVRYRVHQNVTASLPLSTWKRELLQLGSFAVETSRQIHGPDRGFAADVNGAVRKLIARATPVRINDSMRRQKLKALREYWVNRKEMATLSGIRFLAMGLVLLFLPVGTRPWLRKLLKRNAV